VSARARAIFVCAIALQACACTTTTVVTAEPRGARLVVDGVDQGVVPDDGLALKIPRGAGDVPLRVTDAQGALVYEGALARDDLAGWSWAIAMASAAGAVVGCATCATMAFVAANPSIAFAPFAALGSLSIAPLAIVFAAPSCATLPVTGAAAVVGLAPLAGLSLAFAPARFVHVTRAGVVVRERREDGTLAPVHDETPHEEPRDDDAMAH